MTDPKYGSMDPTELQTTSDTFRSAPPPPRYPTSQPFRSNMGTRIPTLRYPNGLALGPRMSQVLHPVQVVASPPSFVSPMQRNRSSQSPFCFFPPRAADWRKAIVCIPEQACTDSNAQFTGHSYSTKDYVQRSSYENVDRPTTLPVLTSNVKYTSSPSSSNLVSPVCSNVSSDCDTASELIHSAVTELTLDHLQDGYHKENTMFELPREELPQGNRERHRELLAEGKPNHIQSSNCNPHDPTLNELPNIWKNGLPCSTDSDAQFGVEKNSSSGKPMIASNFDSLSNRQTDGATSGSLDLIHQMDQLDEESKDTVTDMERMHNEQDVVSARQQDRRLIRRFPHAYVNELQGIVSLVASDTDKNPNCGCHDQVRNEAHPIEDRRYLSHVSPKYAPPMYPYPPTTINSHFIVNSEAFLPTQPFISPESHIVTIAEFNNNNPGVSDGVHVLRGNPPLCNCPLHTDPLRTAREMKDSRPVTKNSEEFTVTYLSRENQYLRRMLWEASIRLQNVDLLDYHLQRLTALVQSILDSHQRQCDLDFQLQQDGTKVDKHTKASTLHQIPHLDQSHTECQPQKQMLLYPAARQNEPQFSTPYSAISYHHDWSTKSSHNDRSIAHMNPGHTSVGMDVQNACPLHYAPWQYHWPVPVTTQFRDGKQTVSWVHNPNVEGTLSEQGAHRVKKQTHFSPIFYGSVTREPLTPVATSIDHQLSSKETLTVDPGSSCPDYIQHACICNPTTFNPHSFQLQSVLPYTTGVEPSKRFPQVDFPTSNSNKNLPVGTIILVSTASLKNHGLSPVFDHKNQTEIGNMASGTSAETTMVTGAGSSGSYEGIPSSESAVMSLTPSWKSPAVYTTCNSTTTEGHTVPTFNEGYPNEPCTIEVKSCDVHCETAATSRSSQKVNVSYIAPSIYSYPPMTVLCCAETVYGRASAMPSLPKQTSISEYLKSPIPRPRTIDQSNQSPVQMIRKQNVPSQTFAHAHNQASFSCCSVVQPQRMNQPRSPPHWLFANTKRKLNNNATHSASLVQVHKGFGSPLPRTHTNATTSAPNSPLLNRNLTIDSIVSPYMLRRKRYAHT